VRQAFATVLPQASPTLLYDVSHNTCKLESHVCNGAAKPVFVHRKGATRALGPGHADLPDGLRAIGQPVLIGGTMGTASYILVGTADGERLSFASSPWCRPRHEPPQGASHLEGTPVIDELAARDRREGPARRRRRSARRLQGGAVVDAADAAGSRKVAKAPLVRQG
jgi:tRNA-splicing ligase RtcB